MQKLEIELREHSFKERALNYYRRNKFPITVEPLLLFSSIAYGLSEVIWEVFKSK